MGSSTRLRIRHFDIRGATLASGESGNALVISLLVLVLLSTMAVTFVAMTKTEKQISGNNLRESQALYVAEAGISEALARMSVSTSLSYIGEGLSSPTPGWGRYIVLESQGSAGDPERGLTESDLLDNDGDGAIDESGETYPEVFSSQVGLDEGVVDYPWVKVRYKQVVLGGVTHVVRFGDHDNNPVTKPVENLVNGLPVLVVTSNGLQGNATKTIEVEAIKFPGPTVPGSIYTEGTLICRGAAFHIDGNDYDPETGEIVAGSTALPGVVATGGTGVVDCKTPQGWDNIEGAGTAPSIAQAAFDLDLPAYMQYYSSKADLVYEGDQNNPNTSGWGGLDDYKSIYIKDGSLLLAGQNSGGGTLLVDKDIMISGMFTWYGMVITMGDIRFTGGGTGVHILGGVLSQGSISDSGDISGNADILYSSEVISRLSDVNPYSISLWREK